MVLDKIVIPLLVSIKLTQPIVSFSGVSLQSFTEEGEYISYGIHVVALRRIVLILCTQYPPFVR